MAARPSITCGNCGSPVGVNDRFCSKCGTALTWGDASVAGTSAPEGKVFCPACGISNLSGNSVCTGCGTSLAAALPTTSGSKKRSSDTPAKKDTGKRRPESWKVLSAAGAVIIIVFIGIGILRNPPKEISSRDQSSVPVPDAGVSPTIVSDIEGLQRNVDANPKDVEAILRLANALHDAKFMPRAIETYKKYLQIKPSDPNARVDMGICYFESGDSPTALKEMETALKYDPKHQMAMFNIGIVSLNQGNLAKSNEWFKKAVAVNPTTPIAQRAQQILTQHSTIPQ